MSVADFHAAAMAMLGEAGHRVRIHPAPNEVDPAIPFAEDKEVRAYDPRQRRGACIGALLAADRVFRLFRSAFLGKVSPVHFFWGSFDLAVTRFSGRPAPLHPGGIPNLPDASPARPIATKSRAPASGPAAPASRAGRSSIPTPIRRPTASARRRWRPRPPASTPALGEFVLDYDAVRAAADPDAALLAFLDSTYEAAADLGNWDRAALECARGVPGVPREV